MTQNEFISSVCLAVGSRMVQENKTYDVGEAVRVAAEIAWQKYDEVTKDIYNDDSEIEPCSVCGDIDGMVNLCCVNYDPLHFKNCGYG